MSKIYSIPWMGMLQVVRYILNLEREFIEWRDIFSFVNENFAGGAIYSRSLKRMFTVVGFILIREKELNVGGFGAKRWDFEEKSVNLRRRRPIGRLATGVE